MKAWKKLEEYCADYLKELGWIRKKKKHYGDSVWDLEGQRRKGECKHYKAHKIHTVKNVTDAKYKDDVIIFTKVKRTHYEPHNVLVTITLEEFRYLSECKRISEKTPPPKFKTKPSIELIYKIRAIRQLFKDIEKLLKAKEEK